MFKVQRQQSSFVTPSQNTGNVEVAPSYWNDKRSIPLLPWLPASRKKRFPVTKRSPKVNSEMLVTPPEANKKVSQDLQGIFGATDSEKKGVENMKMKKKRSSDDSHPLFMADSSIKDENSHMVHDKMVAHTEQKKQKRNASDPDDDEEVDNENGMRASI